MLECRGVRVASVLVSVCALACSSATAEELASAETEQVLQGAAALDLPGYTLVSAETALSSLASKQLSVACPSGTKVLGAGFGVLDDTSAILDGLATYSEPSWDGGSWLTNARKLSTFTAQWKLRVTIVCASSHLSGYEVAVTESALDTSTFKQVESKCPRGKVATSAGYGVLDETSAILSGEALYSLARHDGKGWLTNARNNSTFSPMWKLRTRMICVDAGAIDGYEVVTKDSAYDGVSRKQVHVACPRGKRMLGAGYGVLDDTFAILDGALLYSLPSYSGASWLSNAMNYDVGFSPSFTFRVRTLCAD